MERGADRFDAQAEGFDRRAGVAAGVGRAVARAVLDAVSAGPDDVLVEIGAGTGEIGRHLAPFARYVAIDSSRGMLEVFRSKLSSERQAGRVGLIQSDAEQPWPVRDGAVAAVLASRVAHLLRPDHVMGEIRRVCRPGGYFLVGRIERDPDSPKSRLRHQREALLRDRRMAPRGGAQATQRLLDRLVASGATRVQTRSVASWTSSASPEQILGGWEAMSTIGGVDMNATVRTTVLRELREWARHELGDLGRVADFTERYMLGGIRLGHDVLTDVSERHAITHR